jgi:F0F1-type ATP synthase assembly protein I
MYADVKTILGRYWSAYGGWRAVIRSPYLHLSLILLAITTHFWLTSPWWEQPLVVVPSLLGFSLGGLAMLLSFGNTKFQTFISVRDSGEHSEPSALITTSASFVHFMLAQLLALLVAICFKSLDFYVPWPASFRAVMVACNVLFSAIGYLIFLYSILTMIAAVLAVFRMTSWFETFQNHNKDHKQ